MGTDATTSATHTFTYNDQVSTGPDSYDGFAADDGLEHRLRPARPPTPRRQAAIGALGSSESNSGEGHAYIGFNPISPAKVGSFGGSLQIGGGATEAIAEWIDINGDGLSDKVYRDSDGAGGDFNDVNRDGPIRFRLNTSGRPRRLGHLRRREDGHRHHQAVDRGQLRARRRVRGLSPASRVAFGLGAEVSWGDAYFSDVNADGLPDYVSGGSVWFNHLDANGVPTFEHGQRQHRRCRSATAPPAPPSRSSVAGPAGASSRRRTRWSTPCAGGPRRSPARSRSTRR